MVASNDKSWVVRSYQVLSDVSPWPSSPLLVFQVRSLDPNTESDSYKFGRDGNRKPNLLTNGWGQL